MQNEITEQTVSTVFPKETDESVMDMNMELAITTINRGATIYRAVRHIALLEGNQPSTRWAPAQAARIVSRLQLRWTVQSDENDAALRLVDL